VNRSAKHPHTRAVRRPFAVIVLAAAATVLATSAQAATPAPPLGTAGSFGILAGQGVTNTGPTTITGDLGTHPSPAITNTGVLNISGATHAADAVALGAKNDLVTAYDVAAGAAPTGAIVADLGGQTLVPGVYSAAGALGLTGALTLDAGGDPDAVFIFQTPSTLITASASSVVLTGAARACNVFWQVGSSASLGTASTFVGTVFALSNIAAQTGATIEGRLLARNAAVTLDTNTITRPGCVSVTDAAAAAAAAQAAADLAAAQAAAARQITQVPVGAISAGDGSMAGASGDGVAALAGALMLAAIGGLAVRVRRRSAIR